MKYEYHYTNYATLKKRGCDGNYQYIYTVHKFPVRMPGYEDPDFLKCLNSRYEFNTTTEDDVRFASSLARSRSKVLQLGCNNHWDYFVTLTVSPQSSVDRFDIKGVTNSLLKFFDNYKQRRSSSFKYLVVPECHKNGAVHFHGLFANINPKDLKVNEFGYLDFVPYCKKYGFCSLSAVKDSLACANYICKYICKDMLGGTAPEPGTHLYYSSRGLNTDELLSVGCAVSTPSVDSLEYVLIDSAFTVRYFSERNIFEGYIKPFVNVVTAPQLPSSDKINYYKKRIVYDFCNNNNIIIRDGDNLLSLYDTLKDEIINNSFTEYDRLKAYYKQLKHFCDEHSLTDEECKRLNEMFDAAVLSDLSFDDQCPMLDEFFQLGLFDSDQLCGSVNV